MKAVSHSRSKDVDWKDIVRSRLNKMKIHYGGDVHQCCGIDLRLSAPYVRQELMHCDTCIDYLREDKLVGFVFLKLKPSCIYLSLMCSLERGVGKHIVLHLCDSSHYTQRHIAVRSTDRALGFYLYMGFVLFNWYTADDYISHGDESLTQQLTTQIHVSSFRRQVQGLLRMRQWVEPEMEEWPLIVTRTVVKNVDGLRRSSRLRAQAERSYPTMGPGRGP